MPGLLTENDVVVDSPLIPPDSERVNVSPSKIVIALLSRFSSVLSETPLFDDKPCFRICPLLILVTSDSVLKVNVVNPTTVSTMKSPLFTLELLIILNLLPSASP